MDFAPAPQHIARSCLTQPKQGWRIQTVIRSDACNILSGQHIKQFACFRDIRSAAYDGLTGARESLVQFRQDAAAQEIALEAGIVVGLILNPFQSGATGMCLDVTARHIEQGTQQRRTGPLDTATGRHARQTTRSGTAQQMQQQGFGLIVSMMGKHNEIRIACGSLACQSFVTRLPCRTFQSLYHWGALKNESDKARIGVLIAQKSYDEGMRALAVTLRRSYLELIVKKSLLVQMRYARDLLVEELALAEEKRKNGTLAEGDIAGRKLNLGESNYQIKKNEIEFTASRRSFTRLAGMHDLAEAAIPSEVPKPRHDAAAASALLATIQRDGGRQTFQAQVSELKVRESELNYRIARVGLLPKFNASLGFSLENTTNASATSVSQQGVARQTLAVAANWNIFDGFATKGAKLEALATKRAYERQLQTVSDAALDAAQSLAQQLELDAEYMEMSDLRMGLASAQVGKFKEELAIGNIPQTAVDNIISSLKVSEFNAANARATFLAHWSEFASLVGADPVLNKIPARHDREKR